MTAHGRLPGGIALFVSISVAVLAAAGPGLAQAPRSLLLATTTSVQDSGLLDDLLPAFTRATGIHVRAVAVGTGAALRMGADGDADLLLTHAPESERALVESGAVTRRVEFMENYFVLVGPPEDPADVRGAASVSEALRRIRAGGERTPFVSRADDSGTHKRERGLLEAAGIAPDARWPGQSRTGSGMGLSLEVAGQKRAYILSDIATYLAFRERIGLVVLSGDAPELRNVYAVLPVSPERFPRVHAEAAAALEAWLLGPEARERIARFGIARFGRPLFRPLAAAPAGEP